MERHQPEMIQQEPRVIQIFFDSVEVFRTEDSNECYEKFADTNKEPEVIEMRWNGVVVYSINLPSSMDRSKLQPNFLVHCFSKFLEERYLLD